MENFTPVSALLGGMLIGFAALLLLWWQGRIAGISGILSGVLTPVHHEWLWRVCFVLGLMVGGEIGFSLLGLPAPQLAGLPLWLMVLSGLLVGVGTRLGNGCTSGHGICGIGRLSLRSVVATLCFMATGFITVFIVRHLF